MKYFLSSYKLGVDLLSENKSVAYIPSATDFSVADAARVQANRNDDIRGLEELGLRVVVLEWRQCIYLAPSDDAEWARSNHQRKGSGCGVRLWWL